MESQQENQRPKFHAVNDLPFYTQQVKEQDEGERLKPAEKMKHHGFRAINQVPYVSQKEQDGAKRTKDTGHPVPTTTLFGPGFG